MNRRNFLGAGVAAAAATLPATAALSTPKQSSEYYRLSTEKDDPGFIPYGKLMGDARDFTMYLDGVKTDLVITIDAREGWIKRYVQTDEGNLAYVNGELCTEIVRGHVVIELKSPAAA